MKKSKKMNLKKTTTKANGITLWNWQESRSINVKASDLDKYDTRLWRVMKKVPRPDGKRGTVISYR